MLKFIKEIFIPKHRHVEKSMISMKTQWHRFNIYWVTRIDDAITCYLHTCPTCGELLETGRDAKARGHKVGNYYALRTSIKLAQLIFKTKVESQIAPFTGDKFSVRRHGYDFYFHKKDKKSSRPIIEQTLGSEWVA
jgi:hypothetical protein